MNWKKPDIRAGTAIVIEKDRLYLSRIEMLTGRVVWDQHLSSAWKTRNRKEAQAAAELYGVRMMLFNSIVWEVKPL